MRRLKQKPDELEKLKVYVPTALIRYYRKAYEKNPGKFRDLERSLVSARIPVTAPKYAAIVTFYTLLVSPLLVIASLWISDVIYAAYTSLSSLSIGVGFPIDKSALESAVKFSSEIIAFILLFYFLRTALLKYPSLYAAQRRSKIDSTLPHVVNIMLGMAKGGSSPLEIFRTIAQERAITGEVGKEFSIVVRDVDFFHKDIISALRSVANTTPSSKLSEFLEDLISVLEGGGRLSEFLQFKSSHYIEERERYHEIFLNSMGVLAEIYVSVFVVAPLFALIIFVVMGMLGEEIERLMMAMVYIYIPAGGIAFLWLVYSMVKGEKVEWTAERLRPITIKARVVEGQREPGFKVKTGLVALILRTFIRLRRTLNLSLFLYKPEYLLYITIPVSLALLALSFNRLKYETILIALFAINAFPYTIANEIRSFRVRRLENELPEFLKQLASLNESGLTIVAALRVLSTTNLGALTSEVINIRKDIEWGKLVTEALQRFEARVGSAVVSKVVSILIKALESTDNIKAALFTAATDAEMYLEFRKRMSNEMFVYTIIVYMTFAVFLFTIVVLSENFINIFTKIEAPQTFTGASFTLPDVEMLTRLFYHTTLLNGFFSGLVAGVMGSGSVRAGIKHSLLMVVVSLIVFHYFLGVSL